MLDGLIKSMMPGVDFDALTYQFSEMIKGMESASKAIVKIESDISEIKDMLLIIGNNHPGIVAYMEAKAQRQQMTGTGQILEFKNHDGN